MGEISVRVDCDVLQADGGTRTASITGAWIALHDALASGRDDGVLGADPLVDHCAAVSVGVRDGDVLLDLDYPEDVSVDVDFNVVMTGSGRLIEVQGTAEGHAFTADELNAMLVLAKQGDLPLVGAAPDSSRELARFPAIEGRTWNHPALAGDVLLMRNGQEMAAQYPEYFKEYVRRGIELELLDPRLGEFDLEKAREDRARREAGERVEEEKPKRAFGGGRGGSGRRGHWGGNRSRCVVLLGWSLAVTADAYGLFAFLDLDAELLHELHLLGLVGFQLGDLLLQIL